MFNREDYVMIKTKYDNIRRKAENDNEERRERICKEIPEIKKICDMLADTGPRVYAAALEGGEDYKKKLELIKRENEELLKKQRDILTQNGYPADYLDIKYNCPLCRDEGNIDGKMCECMKKELIIAGYESAGISGLCRKMNFDTFDLSFYEGPEKKNMGIILKRARDYAENFKGDGSGSILFFGGTGLGKTHLSVAIAKRVIEGGYYCIYTTADAIFTDFRNDRFSDNRIQKVTEYENCELLVIDDLGTELNGRDIVSFLYNLLNKRLNNRKSTIISTNLTNKELLAAYDERIVSRLFGEFLTYRFTGKDVRMQKLQK